MRLTEAQNRELLRTHGVHATRPCGRSVPSLRGPYSRVKVPIRVPDAFPHPEGGLRLTLTRAQNNSGMIVATSG
jgi:hypothetical protein